jgi:sporulation protein YlmC with PRC-barrel domain
MIDLPMKAEVWCLDGLAGHSTYVIGNPINHQMTHLVVKSTRQPFCEYLVPVEQVEEATPDRIKLKCTREDLYKMKPFEYQECVRTELACYIRWPFALVDPMGATQEGDTYMRVIHQNIPQGEVAVWRGARVEATDGYVGQVDELLINSDKMQVTHLVLLEGHVFKDRELIIPVSQIDRVDEDTIHLKLDRQSVERLPTTPIQRWPEYRFQIR